MTRKEFYKYAKKYGFAILGALPFLILAGVFLGDIVSLPVLVIIDCAILLIAYFLALVIADKHEKNIALKREALLKKRAEEAEQLKQQELAEKKEKEEQERLEKELKEKEEHRKKCAQKKDKYQHLKKNKRK
ncbi:MAG: hypothetical protein IJZ26_03715 [Clostridia bacterium]|nr:hypothetical protein [Clostridia bacterium]